MADYKQMLYDIEVHSVEGIQGYFCDGGDPNEVRDGVPLFATMVEMYARTPRFHACVKAFVDAGLDFDDEALLAVLMDDPGRLHASIKQAPEVVNKAYSLFNNTFTPLTGGTLMHFCAEYNSIHCAKILVQWGADINAKASLDEFGFGGHTPIFHTVNQNNNNSLAMLRFLLDQSADLSVTVKGLIWGKGYEWETFIPAVNPLSYAMMGLLPQMHRKDKVVSEVITLLLKHAYGIDYLLPNIPNAYLNV